MARGSGRQFLVDEEAERRIVRRLDLTLVPMLWALMIVSFADRSAIGNAKIQGMDEELTLTGNKYNMAVMVFTIAYMAFGVPASLAFKKLGPKSLAGMMILWGICALGQGLVENYGGLVAMRFLMGVFEAGFVPGSAYLIGSYYKSNEFLKRYAIFFSGAIIAGAFNGLFSFLLAKADGQGGLAGWRWIFIVEGLITCILGFVTFFLLPPFPEDTTMFQGRDKVVLLQRLKEDVGDYPHDGFRYHMFLAFLDWKIWLSTIIYMSAQENVSSIAAFLPSILKGLGYTSVSAQIHSIPVYCTAFTLTLICAYLSERVQQRYFFALFGGIINLTGLVVQVGYPESITMRYAGTFLMTAGCYTVMPIVVVWNGINTGQGNKRAIAFAMTTAVGNCGALISSNVYITDEAPHYQTGFSVGIGMSCLSITAMTVLYVCLKLANRDKAYRTSHEPESIGMHDLHGDEAIHYQYRL